MLDRLWFDGTFWNYTLQAATNTVPNFCGPAFTRPVGFAFHHLAAPHRVPGTDLGSLFASNRPGAAPGAWHRFGARADGTVETITGTTIHPVWSVDRQEWVPLAELAQGEGLCCDTESLGLGFPSSLSPKASGLVLSVSLSRVSQPVYNIEVHGEHVYQVGELGVLVHNVRGG